MRKNALQSCALLKPFVLKTIVIVCCTVMWATCFAYVGFIQGMHTAYAAIEKPTKTLLVNPSAVPVKEKDDTFVVGVLYWSMNIPGQVAMREGLEATVARINAVASETDQPGVSLVPFVAGDGELGMDRQITQMRDLITQNLSMCFEMCGKASLHHSPDSPYRANLRCDASNFCFLTLLRRNSTSISCPSLF